MVFLKVDVDEADGVAQKYDISAMPTFVFLKGSDSVKTNLSGLKLSPQNFSFLRSGYRKAGGRELGKAEGLDRQAQMRSWRPQILRRNPE